MIEVHEIAAAAAAVLNCCCCLDALTLDLAIGML
jgi:hypothetical protein